MSTPVPHGHNQVHPAALPDQSGAVPTSAEARAKCRIAALEEQLETIKQDSGTKQRFATSPLLDLCFLLIEPRRKTTYYIAQGRVIRCMVVLYTSLEDLITENDRRYEELPESNTVEQDHVQRGYITFTQVLPWLHGKLAELDVDDCEDMQKKEQTWPAEMTLPYSKTSLRHGSIKTFARHPYLGLMTNSRCGFVHDVCGRLLCPAEWDWDNNLVKAGIHDRMSEYISFGKLLANLLACSSQRFWFRPSKLYSPLQSSAKEADGDGDGADILENNQARPDGS
ncbi:hypothetical protein EV702DRAFT_1195138 [Suillus placidus]|uniref:Uncharacterized protein n=1 Tax=Suillus placidus TaxID=48579 RepID=A0A9P6ZZP2_9AGAM|nr:hypothetical protein EV702DRAFT_1195138 [Suillus placidus]